MASCPHLARIERAWTSAHLTDVFSGLVDPISCAPRCPKDPRRRGEFCKDRVHLARNEGTPHHELVTLRKEHSRSTHPPGWGAGARSGGLGRMLEQHEQLDDDLKHGEAHDHDECSHHDLDVRCHHDLDHRGDRWIDQERSGH